MRYVKVKDSENIEGLIYDPATRMLTVKFCNGSVYSYREVPGDIVGKVAFSKSVGKAFNSLIPQNYYGSKVGK